MHVSSSFCDYNFKNNLFIFYLIQVIKENQQLFIVETFITIFRFARFVAECSGREDLVIISVGCNYRKLHTGIYRLNIKRNKFHVSVFKQIVSGFSLVFLNQLIL